jgi:hypothetical protein
MDPNICIAELERIVKMGPAYVGPHGDPLAHAYGVASVLRDLASTDDQKEKVSMAIAEIVSWYKANQRADSEGAAREVQKAIAAIAALRDAYTLAARENARIAMR